MSGAVELGRAGQRVWVSCRSEAVFCTGQSCFQSGGYSTTATSGQTMQRWLGMGYY